jgi:hypothetical protein
MPTSAFCASVTCLYEQQAGQCDPRIKVYLQFYPLPNTAITGDVGKFAFTSIRLGDEKYIIGKIDHYFSSSTTLNGSYSWDDTTLTSPDAYGEKLSNAPTRRINGLITLQHLFSPNLINNARVGVTRSRAANNLQCCVNIPALADPSLGFIPGHPTGSFTVTGIAGTSNFGGLRTDGLNDFHYTAPQFYDDVSWTKGRHSMRMGFGFERVISNIDERNYQRTLDLRLYRVNAD